MMKGSKKKQPRGRYSPRSTYKHADLFWEWFLDVNPEISKRAFRKELERDNDPAAAFERLFVKMNRSAAKTQSKIPSGKCSGGK
jgi:hypothetical protein